MQVSWTAWATLPGLMDTGNIIEGLHDLKPYERIP